SFVQQVIEANTTIPVILVTQEDSVISYKNIPERLQESRKLQQLVEEYKKSNTPIEIVFSDTERQYLYYGNSLLLIQLSYFPFVQLIAVFIFLVFVIWALLSTKKAEQNEVWVGLSKETAHQLGTPISSLMAWTEIFKSKYIEDSMFGEMEKDVNRLRTIAERFSQIGSKTDLEIVNLNQVIHNAVDYLRTRISKKITLSIQETEVLYCELNVSLFEWVIENLCKNAADAMSGDGIIKIQLSQKGKEIRIDVIDNGKGVSKHNSRKIFNPGFTTKKRGWGLGLSLAKRIIEEYHQGKIFVQHTEIDKGTTFRIIFYVQ
ncbi:MAG TPA: HAMP domain-containing sensor histidine kinase, partial [Paludibacteraceae bacterium]|nr:HAMP domain-containing sensor histidine kinase [Paludibacteraceae bacterium]